MICSDIHKKELNKIKTETATCHHVLEVAVAAISFLNTGNERKQLIIVLGFPGRADFRVIGAR